MKKIETVRVHKVCDSVANDASWNRNVRQLTEEANNAHLYNGQIRWPLLSLITRRTLATDDEKLNALFHIK
jgi:hypothetical protein